MLHSFLLSILSLPFHFSALSILLSSLLARAKQQQLTVIFVLSQHEYFPIWGHRDGELNGRTAHVAIFNVTLLALADIDNQLVALAAVGAINDLGIGSKTHAPV